MSQIQTDRSNKSIQAIVAWVVTVCTFGYFLPWAIAATRGKSNAGAIFWVNFLAGWTVIGWIIALVMAAGSHQVVQGPVVVNQWGAAPGMPGGYPPQAYPQHGQPAYPPAPAAGYPAPAPLMPPPPPTEPLVGALEQPIDAEVVEDPPASGIEFGKQ